MKTIGFIDYFLDEWHAENYPRWIKESLLGGEYRVGLAWGETNVHGKRTNEEWCQAHGVKLAGSLDELIDRSDYLVVLAPDHPERHESLALPALASGKPTYVDKPFASDLATARRIIAAAASAGTPLFSSSALRFAKELDDAREKLAGHALEFIATGGGNNFVSYAVHQAEMQITLAGRPARRVKYCGTLYAALVVIDFGDGLTGSIQVMQGAPFRVSVVSSDNQTYHAAQIQAAFFPRFIQSMLEFFSTGQAPFAQWQTEAVMALLDAAFAARKQPDTWVEVEAVPV